MQTTSFTTIVLKPESGNYLTQAADVAIQDRAIATTVALGKNDTQENWKEITAEEAEELKRLQQEYFEQQKKKLEE